MRRWRITTPTILRTRVNKLLDTLGASFDGALSGLAILLVLKRLFFCIPVL